LDRYRAGARGADYPEGGQEMQGRITRISVTYELDGIEGGAKYRFIGTPALERYMRPERFEELMEDLTLGCEQVLTARQDPDKPALKVVQ
jgi:hypothetical protein